MRVVIEVIDHDKQRYSTVGDWQWLDEEKTNLKISVSKMSDWRYEMLVAVHELHEVLLCKNRGITQEEVDRFDILYEANRPEGDTSEPGDARYAPYFFQHQFATILERLFAKELDVDWEVYDKTVANL